jgi:polyisoprenoid-binding protein YceI
MVSARLPSSVATAVFLGLAAPMTHAQTAASLVCTLNRAASVVEFTITGSMIFKMTQDGRFQDFTGTVAYDPEHPSDAQVDLTVYTASVDTGDAEHDELLKSLDFFDVEHFPTMQFVSSSAMTTSDRMFAVTGDMTIRGVTKRMTIPVSFRPDQSVSDLSSGVLESTFEIDRTEFGLIGIPKWNGLPVSISKNVQIHLAMSTTPHQCSTRPTLLN